MNNSDKRAARYRVMTQHIITSTNYEGVPCVLVHSDTGEITRAGDKLPDFRGDVSEITGGSAPHKPSSTGFVRLESGREVYAGVFNLKWVSADET